MRLWLRALAFLRVICRCCPFRVLTTVLRRPPPKHLFFVLVLFRLPCWVAIYIQWYISAVDISAWGWHISMRLSYQHEIDISAWGWHRMRWTFNDVSYKRHYNTIQFNQLRFKSKLPTDSWFPPETRPGWPQYQTRHPTAHQRPCWARTCPKCWT